MDVPVIILNWNGWEDTFTCLRSLRATDDVSEVWLVDSHSREDRSEEAATYYPGLRIIRLDDNYGWAGGNNRALHTAADEGYEFAYLLNNDCEVHPAFLSPAIDGARQDPGMAAVGSIVESARCPGTVQFDGVYRADGSTPLPCWNGLRPAPYFSGAGVLMRLSAAKQCGAFDERLFCYGEETLWSWSVMRAGWRIGVCADTRVSHWGGNSDVSANALYYTIRNQFIWLEMVDASFRRQARAGAIYRGLVGATKARCSGDRSGWLAIVTGLRDGISGRFGKRGTMPLSWKFMMQLSWWTTLATARDKVRCMCRLAPGHPPIEVWIGRGAEQDGLVPFPSGTPR